MPRRGRIPERVLNPDPIYHTTVVAKLINYVMERGKKSLAETIVYNAFSMVGEKTQKNPLEVFEKAVNNARPLLEVKPRRVGGATYQVPVEVPVQRGISMSLRWMVNSMRKRSGGQKRAFEKLAAEILDAYNNTGASIKRRDDAHKSAEANRAFAHFRW
ncbi:MAG: 30S ribosomal protein S7 [candidate division WS2 bacterium]|uniref:Small ribosomal subunit protein uS7 n=1 Tax=Psychracetigena formicireducens TaxID=2986056 RepID=A0A9E2BFF0_PSYF1|nr:30S ribosomal protein S7 [Candidatus Psychracetigena formicireducens]MBT9144618.1 30S ribosomal protein S7 [Candidatus Psychracetigena formicireducens]MBT9150263.1 30S ribosomal protein S7 [Candidatus Psychracetigena formicireducens]